MLSIFKPKWRVTCEDATGLTFVEILPAATRAELEQIAIEREWQIRGAVRSKFDPVRSTKLFISSITDRVTTKNLVAFYRQLSNMYKNHVPLLKPATPNLCSSDAVRTPAAKHSSCAPPNRITSSGCHGFLDDMTPA